MQIIILTGTIGSGKSTVAAILRELGAPVINTDELARHIIDPGTPAFRKVVEYFGTEIVDDKGAIDRKKLAAKVFTNPTALDKLNSIVHPAVDDVTEAFFDQFQADGKKYVFVEMAILAKIGWQQRVDRYWVVKVDQATALNRLAERGVKREDALARLANQPDPLKNLSKPFDILTNDSDLKQLRQKVEKLWQKLDNK
jgi:dephospho-CoA kinase